MSLLQPLRFSSATVLFAAALTLGAGSIHAQTVTTLPLPKATFCHDEAVTVNYTVTGSFVPGNAFIVQLSGPNGSFSSEFTNLSSIASTSSGSINAVIPKDIEPGAAYRIRVIGSNPRINGSDNGTDLAIGAYPAAQINYEDDGNVIGMRDAFVTLINLPVTLHDSYNQASARSWNFGPGATPPSSASDRPMVVFSTPGKRQIAMGAFSPLGCDRLLMQTIDVRSPDPIIPSDALIVDAETALGYGNNNLRAIWVCPGGVLSLDGYFDGDRELTVYVEAGGSVVLGHAPDIVIYLRNGASVRGELLYRNAIIYEDGAGIPNNQDILKIKVPSITFDYSQVPPGGCPSLAPYTVQIKPDVPSIAVPQQDDRSRVEYYITGAGSLGSQGSHNAYYLESGATVNISGDSSMIYVKSGATARVTTGRGHRIFHELGADVSSPGEDAVLLPSSGITYEGRVSSVSVMEAPESMVQVSPNPARERMELEIDERLGRLVDVRVVDAVGRTMLDVDEPSRHMEIAVDDLIAGIYLVRITTDRGEYVRRVVVE